jgi:hypothetical protein
MDECKRRKSRSLPPGRARDDISGRCGRGEDRGNVRKEMRAGLKSAATLSFVMDDDEVNCGHEDSSAT